MPARTRPKVNRGEPMLSVRECAEQLDVNIRTIYNMLASGRLRGYKVGRAVRVARSDLDAMLVEYTVGGPGGGAK